VALTQAFIARIPASSDTSQEINLAEFEIHAIQMPASFTGTAITLLGAQRSASTILGTADTMQAVYDSGGNAISFTVAQGRFIVLTAAHRDALNALSRVQFKSGATEGAQRDIVVVVSAR
jgi:hypothetical protein